MCDDRHHQIRRGAGDRARRHTGDKRVGRFLDDDRAAGLGHRGHSDGAVVERAGEHDGNRTRAPGTRERAEHRIGGGADPVLRRAVAQLDGVRAHQQVLVGGAT